MCGDGGGGGGPIGGEFGTSPGGGWDASTAVGGIGNTVSGPGGSGTGGAGGHDSGGNVPTGTEYGGYVPGQSIVTATGRGDNPSAVTSGGSSGGSGGLAGVDASINAALPSGSGIGDIAAASSGQQEAEQAEQAAQMEMAIQSANANNIDNPSKAKAFLISLGKLAGGLLAGKLGSMAMDALLSWGLNTDTANSAINAISNGIDSATVANGISSGDFGGATGGGPGDTTDYTNTGGTTESDGTSGGGAVTTQDPTSYSFWNDFVDEWMGKNTKSAQQMYEEDDAYKKAQVAPAIQKYKDVLADLANQIKTGTGLYTPTTFGMGNFRSSFIPRSQLAEAENLKGYGKEDLTSSLALTDVMQPNKGSREYLDALKSLAIWQYEQQQAKDLAEKGYATQEKVGTYTPPDQGSWLDTIKDIVQIGDTVGDALDKYFS